MCSSCFPKGFFWTYVRAPEPSDIYWENLGLGACKRLGRFMASWIATTIVLVLCIIVIAFVKNA